MHSRRIPVQRPSLAAHRRAEPPLDHLRAVRLLALAFLWGLLLGLAATLLLDLWLLVRRAPCQVALLVLLAAALLATRRHPLRLPRRR